MPQSSLNNAQLEIVKLFTKPLTKKDLNELRKILQDFLARKIDDEVDQICKDRNINQSKIDEMLNTHIKRTK